MMESLQVLDFSPLSINLNDDSIDQTQLKSLSQKLIENLSNIGFVYLSNTGIDKNLVNKIFKLACTFFHLPISQKCHYKVKDGVCQGWSGPELQAFNPEKPGDLREAYDVAMEFLDGDIWPDKEVPELKPLMKNFYQISAILAHRIMLAIAVGLNLSDKDFFKKRHNFMDPKLPFSSALRTLYYPVNIGEVKEGQMMLGEHTDFGTVTLLFQNDIRGLQVRNREGFWIDADPIPGTVLINVGDLLQRWTSDLLVSTPHRVCPTDPQSCFRLKPKPRQSIVFFAIPDRDVNVECLDGSSKYESVKAGDYLKKRIAETYRY